MNVSIVIPTYNRPDLLERLLISISKQTYSSYEVIIVNDNSDNISAYDIVISKFRKIIDELSYYINDENKGAPYSRNFGIKKAKYDILALVDDDDEWLSEKLQFQINEYLKTPNIGIVTTWTYECENNDFKKGVYESKLTNPTLSDILSECFIPSPSVLISKAAIVKAGLFDLKMPSCQDWDMWTRVMKLGYSVKIVQEYLTIYHKHSQGNIGMSKKAFNGYKMYYNKHWFTIIKNLRVKGLIILLKHLYSRILRIN